MAEKKSNHRKTYGAGISIGLLVGVVFGLLTDNLVMGLCIGVAIGCGGSTAAVTRNKHDREKQ